MIFDPAHMQIFIKTVRMSLGVNLQLIFRAYCQLRSSYFLLSGPKPEIDWTL